MIDFFIKYFTDPILRGPTIGCMLVCFASALIGVVAYLRKQSLLGESLSHAAYPGVIIGIIFAGEFGFDESDDAIIALFVVIGAFCSAFLGLAVINFLQKKLRIHSDSALCFVLASFFGLGITLASDVQFSYSSLYRNVQAYLYGQAATLGDQHVILYLGLTLAILLFVCLFYKEIQIITFNPLYAKSTGVNVNVIKSILIILIVLSIVIGIRSVGVVLMSAMIVCPVVAARQFTHRLSRVFMGAGLIGMISGFLGNVLSVELDYYFSVNESQAFLTLPTGPMIVLVASSICLFSLVISRSIHSFRTIKKSEIMSDG